MYSSVHVIIFQDTYQCLSTCTIASTNTAIAAWHYCIIWASTPVLAETRIAGKTQYQQRPFPPLNLVIVDSTDRILVELAQPVLWLFGE